MLSANLEENSLLRRGYCPRGASWDIFWKTDVAVEAHLLGENSITIVIHHPLVFYDEQDRIWFCKDSESPDTHCQIIRKLPSLHKASSSRQANSEGIRLSTDQCGL